MSGVCSQRQKVWMKKISFKNLWFCLDLDESYISLSKINPASLANSSKESLSPKKSSDEEVLNKDNQTFTKQNKNNNDDNHNKQNHYLQENLDLKQVS